MAEKLRILLVDDEPSIVKMVGKRLEVEGVHRPHRDGRPGGLPKAREKDEKLGMECGANAYVRKPFRAQELIGTIRSLIGTSAPQAGPSAEPGTIPTGGGAKPTTQGAQG